MILHVTADYAESTTLRALQKLMLTLLKMSHSLFIRTGKATFRHATFELETEQILLNIPMQVFELNSIVSKTLFGA